MFSGLIRIHFSLATISEVGVAMFIHGPAGLVRQCGSRLKLDGIPFTVPLTEAGNIGIGNAGECLLRMVDV